MGGGRRPLLGIVSALSLFVVCGLTSAQPLWTAETFPNSISDPTRCNTQGSASTACDPDGVLSKEGFKTLDTILKDITIGNEPYAKSSCATDSKAPGFKVAVAVMERMRVSGDAASTARRFAKDLHTNWGVGDASCSDGVLMLLSVEDRQVFISTGKAARHKLTDDYAATIIASMKPNLRRGDYDGAIQQAAVDIGLVLAGSVPEDPSGEASDGGSNWLGIGVFLGCLGLMLSGCCQSFATKRQSRRCRSLLDKLKKDQAQALAQHRFPATTCPICMEDIQAPRGTPEADEAGPSHSVDVGPSSSQAGGADGHDEASSSREAAGSSSSPSAPLLDGSKSKEDPTENARKRPALTLPCGHTFCEECIDRWVQGKNTCPICRKPLDRDAPPPGKLAEQQQERQRHRHFDQNMIAAETAFRLANLQQMYPNQINRDMLDRWTDQAQHGALIDWNNQRALALDAAAHHQSFHSPDTGVSAFGGGSSFGGGGSGGSW